MVTCPNCADIEMVAVRGGRQCTCCGYHESD